MVSTNSISSLATGTIEDAFDKEGCHCIRIYPHGLGVNAFISERVVWDLPWWVCSQHTVDLICRGGSHTRSACVLLMRRGIYLPILLGHVPWGAILALQGRGGRATGRGEREPAGAGASCLGRRCVRCALPTGCMQTNNVLYVYGRQL